jgi:hypothetical protein
MANEPEKIEAHDNALVWELLLVCLADGIKYGLARVNDRPETGLAVPHQERSP